MGVKLKHLPHTERINLATWGYFARGGRELGREISAIIEAEFNDPNEYEGIKAFLPIQYAPRCDGLNGKPVTDPLTIYVQVPLGPNSDEHPTYSVTLFDLIADLIEYGECVSGVSSRLRELADLLDEKLPEQSKDVQAQCESEA